MIVLTEIHLHGNSNLSNEIPSFGTQLNMFLKVMHKSTTAAAKKRNIRRIAAAPKMETAITQQCPNGLILCVTREEIIPKIKRPAITAIEPHSKIAKTIQIADEKSAILEITKRSKQIANPPRKVVPFMSFPPVRKVVAQFLV